MTNNIQQSLPLTNRDFGNGTHGVVDIRNPFDAELVASCISRRLMWVLWKVMGERINAGINMYYRRFS